MIKRSLVQSLSSTLTKPTDTTTRQNDSIDGTYQGIQTVSYYSF